MQIALVAVVLLAGMWFTVLKPKPADSGSAFQPTATPAAQPAAPGAKGLATAVDKAKGAAAATEAATAKTQAATGGNAATAAKPAAAKGGTKAATAKAVAAKPAAAKAAAPAKAAKPGATKAAATEQADPSERLLAVLDKGKVLVILFEGKGAIDKAARRAVHLTAKHDPKHVVSAYVPIAEVGAYEAITSDVQILTSPTVLVIGADHKATPLTGYVDATVIRQAVADARRGAAKK